jgi:hypothetical protein
MFHPIAYQFYFFSIAGLAVALKNTCRTAIARAHGPVSSPLRPVAAGTTQS